MLVIVLSPETVEQLQKRVDDANFHITYVEDEDDCYAKLISAMRYLVYQEPDDELAKLQEVFLEH